MLLAQINANFSSSDGFSSGDDGAESKPGTQVQQDTEENQVDDNGKSFSYWYI